MTASVLIVSSLLTVFLIAVLASRNSAQDRDAAATVASFDPLEDPAE